MEIIEYIKKYSGLLIIPLTFTAFYIEFGLLKVGPLDAFPANIVLALEFVTTVLTISFVMIMFHFGLVCYLATFFDEKILFLAIGVIFLCFGMLGPLKTMEDVPLKEIGLFWHYSSLAYSFWLFSITKVESESNTNHVK